VKTERLAQALFLASTLATFVQAVDCLAPAEDGTPCYVLESRAQKCSLQDLDPSGLCEACIVRMESCLLTLSVGVLGVKLGYTATDLDELTTAFRGRVSDGAWPPEVCGCHTSRTSGKRHLFAPCLELGLADVRPRKEKN
jgi:hypothetical protein